MTVFCVYVRQGVITLSLMQNCGSRREEGGEASCDGEEVRKRLFTIALEAQEEALLLDQEFNIVPLSSGTRTR